VSKLARATLGLRAEALAALQLRRVDSDQPNPLTLPAEEPHVERVSVHDISDSASEREAPGLRARRRSRSDERDGNPGTDAKSAERQRLQ
jgi:hypothetical protein